MKKKILLVFGTRPEAIKMCPLVVKMRQAHPHFDTMVCVTGQHRELLDQVLDVFSVKPDYDLNIMRQGQDLHDITTKVLLGMRAVLQECRPDIVLVHGDTTTSMAAALAAFYHHIPIGHVEAGLRTYCPEAPWPEEMNRQLTSRMATYHFAPTALAAKNLEGEQVAGQVVVTGNTVIDALHAILEKMQKDASVAEKQARLLAAAGYDMQRLHEGRRLVLITGHRRENFGKGFEHICQAIQQLAEKYTEVDFVYPLHPNRHVHEAVHKVFGSTLQRYENLFFIQPLEYTTFVCLMEKAHVVLTDSGGIQEEAPGIGKPVLVMRATTERPEAVKAGTVQLVGTNCQRIVQGVSALLDDDMRHKQMSRAVNPYGDGRAADRIIDFLKSL